MAAATEAAGNQPVEVDLEQLLQTPISITSVRSQGATRTNPALLSYLTRSALSTGGSFSSVIDDISQVVEALRLTNCFRGVDAYVDRAAQSTASVLFTLSEKSLYQIRTGTSIETSGDRDASVEAAFVWRNVRGKLDTLQATVNWLGNAKALSEQPSMSWDVSYKLPFVFRLNDALFAHFGRTNRSHEEESGYTAQTTGGEVGLDLPIGRVSIGNTLRELSVEPQGPALIREEVGHSWKTSVKHEVLFDGRDHAPMPTQGAYFSLREEIGLPLMGSVTFAKVESEAQLHLPLGSSGACASIIARGGIVSGVGGQKVSVQDRFFLGGSNSMRGFKPRGLGPWDGRHAIGGKSFYCLTGMASIPVPTGSLLWQLFNARVHIFGSVGDLSDSVFGGASKSLMKRDRSITMSQNLKEVWQKMQKSMRVSAGVGVALETSFGRVEVNLCQSIRAHEGDRVQTGVQFSVSETLS